MTAEEKVIEIRDFYREKLVEKINEKNLFYSKEEFEDEINKNTRLHIINQRDFWGYCKIELQTKYLDADL